MPKFRKKPVVIEAHIWDGYQSHLPAEFEGAVKGDYPNGDGIIPTLEGDMLAKIGDYIIKGVNGEFYPCKAEIFKKTYDAVDDVLAS